MAKLQESTQVYNSAFFHGKHGNQDIDRNLHYFVVGSYLQWFVGHFGIYGVFAIAIIEGGLIGFTDLHLADCCRRAIVDF